MIPRKAIVGGTFDPVHLGHLHLIHSIYKATSIPHISLVPAFINNFKQDRTQSASSRHRLAMVRLAIEAYKGIYPEDVGLHLDVDTQELERKGVSYTIDTVEQIRTRDAYTPSERLGFIMGDDLLNGLSRWHRYPDLSRQVLFLICRRLAVKPDTPLPEGAKALFIDNPVYEDSSTLIRELMGGSQLPSLENLCTYMPREVASYVLEHELYRA